VCIGLLGAAVTTYRPLIQLTRQWAMMPRQMIASIAAVASVQNFGGYLGGSIAQVVTNWIVQTFVAIRWHW
jgi:hypothetical protein